MKYVRIEIDEIYQGSFLLALIILSKQHKPK